MKKSKGFSLIELLAVVIILAVLALILVPFIGNLIREAKINAAVVSAYGYVEAANNEIVSKSTKGEFVEETQYDIKDYNIVGNSMNIKYEGKGPDKGYFNISRSKVSDGVFCINGYEVRYEDGKATYDPEGGYCSAPLTATLCRLKNDLVDAGTKYAEETTFYIETADDLYCLSELVNAGTDDFNGKTIILKKDINMKDVNSYLPESGYVTYNEQHEPVFAPVNPIGNENNQFQGSFYSANFNTLSGVEIDINSSYVGLFGHIGSNARIGQFNYVNSSISGKKYTGGIAGYNNGGTIYSMNIEDVTVTTKYTVTTNESFIGGIAGYNVGTIKEIATRQTVTGKKYTGGIAGVVSTGSLITNVLIESDVTGTVTVGGVYGQTDSSNQYIYVVVNGGNITGTTGPGKISANNYYGLAYASDVVTLTGANNNGMNGMNGTAYTSDNANLSYFGSIKYTENNIQYPLLDSVYTGDVNNTGWWFDYDYEGKIVVVRVNTPVNQPEPDPENCGNEPCPEPPVPIDTIGTSTGNLCEGDNVDTTPPTCTFEKFEAVSNGIRAYFSCSDDTSVPTIASMFNSMSKQPYTFANIKAQGGTEKTGSVNGNTRTIRSTWTTSYDGPKPQPGLCYYYQFAAKDACGNEADFVTTYCSYGFTYGTGSN